MKRVILTSVAFFVFCIASNATKRIITVSNFQFSPSNVVAVIGDTIRWEWLGGNHTTTCDPSQDPSCSLPAGAQTWDNNIKSSTPSFEYVIQVAGAYHYVCLPHAGSGMVADINGVLPLKLSSLLVSGKGNNVSVKWETEMEDNLDYFSVRRSLNSSSFEEVGKVPASGFATAGKSYSYTDKLPAKQKYAYYNLVAVDKDGKKTFSEIKPYKNVDAPVKLITSLSPNPISRPGHLMLTFNAESEGEMDVVVIDASGKIILTDEMHGVAGTNKGHLHLGDLPSGTYTVIFRMNGMKETHKVLYK